MSEPVWEPEVSCGVRASVVWGGGGGTPTPHLAGHMAGILSAGLGPWVRGEASESERLIPLGLHALKNPPVLPKAAIMVP